MQLAEIIGTRQIVGAGLLVVLTECCPLSCAHCSSSATRVGAALDAQRLLGFLRTTTRRSHPNVVLLTGGEPLTRPGLVEAAARTARRAGSRTAVVSGAFFARRGHIPPAVRTALTAVDHVSFSIDVFHEREVGRAQVFGALQEVLDLGVAASLHVTGSGPNDPYLAGVTGEVTRRFGSAVPMLVNRIRPIGRAGSWLAGQIVDGTTVAPCAMAAWPVVAADGVITACCNQDVVDGRQRAAPFVVGDVATSSWAEVLTALRERAFLRMVRAVGPAHMAERATGLPVRAAGYCSSCHELAGRPQALAWSDRVAAGPAGELLEAAAISAGRAGGPVALVRRHGIARYAHLVDPAGTT